MLDIYPRSPVTQECHVEAPGTGMLLTKSYLGYLGPYEGKSVWSRSFFPCMDLSQAGYII